MQPRPSTRPVLLLDLPAALGGRVTRSVREPGSHRARRRRFPRARASRFSRSLRIAPPSSARCDPPSRTTRRRSSARSACGSRSPSRERASLRRGRRRGAETLFRGADAAALAHAYLFTGPSGVGKKTFARRWPNRCCARRRRMASLDTTAPARRARFFAAETRRIRIFSNTPV